MFMRVNSKCADQVRTPSEPRRRTLRSIFAGLSPSAPLQLNAPCSHDFCQLHLAEIAQKQCRGCEPGRRRGKLRRSRLVGGMPQASRIAVRPIPHRRSSPHCRSNSVLKLEPRKRSVDVLVIDSVERPTEG